MTRPKRTTPARDPYRYGPGEQLPTGQFRSRGSEDHDGEGRKIDREDRADREGQGMRARKYSWRSMVGPAPNALPSDRAAARDYLARITAAIEHGGWTASEASGLYKARDKWRARAMGEDPRYEMLGTAVRGLDKQEAAYLRDRRLIAEMIKRLKQPVSGK